MEFILGGICLLLIGLIGLLREFAKVIRKKVDYDESDKGKDDVKRKDSIDNLIVKLEDIIDELEDMR